MKTERTILICLSLLIVVLPALAAAVPNYIVCCQQTEKWYLSEASGQAPEMRIHTMVNGAFNGAVIQEKEIWVKNNLIDSERLLFNKDSEGNIFYFGDLDEYVLEDPILWVDAPLEVGKTWKDSCPEYPGSNDSEKLIHYVFAVLSKGDIACPAGTFPAHCVLQTVIYPDGQIDNQAFWYNDHCGMVMCTMSDQTSHRIFELRKAIIPGLGEFPDIHFDNPVDGGGMSGLSGLKASPNPLNPMTTISFDLGSRSMVNLRVYDVSGKLVRTLVGGEIMGPGERAIQWNGEDDRGSKVASGIYFYKLQAGGEELSNSITLIR